MECHCQPPFQTQHNLEKEEFCRLNRLETHPLERLSPLPSMWNIYVCNVHRKDGEKEMIIVSVEAKSFTEGTVRHLRERDGKRMLRRGVDSLPNLAAAGNAPRYINV